MQRIDADHEDRVGVVEVRHPGAVVGPGELAEQSRLHRVGGAVDVGGARRRGGSAGPASPPRSRCRRRPGPRRSAGVPDRVGDPPHRLVPGDRAEAAVAGADHRPGDPVGRVEHLEGEAALVAEPAVVDLGVVAGVHPQDPLVADREADVALARAERADRACLLDVPGPGAEAVGVGGQRPDGAELDDVAVERGDVGPLVEGADERVVAALEQLELLVLGDLLAEADAAVAEDAALAVDRHQR